MKKASMIIDVEKCNGCHNCFLACKDEFAGNDWPSYSAAQPRHGAKWLTLAVTERGEYPMLDVAYLPVPCQHCEDAPCLVDDAVYRRPDGIVLIDPEKARGREDLAELCPYGAINWNTELQLPQKCTFCAHLIDAGWDKPRCVQACPTGALAFHLSEEKTAQPGAAKDGAVLHPEYQTSPRIAYRGLNRIICAFIGGSVITRTDGITECLEGATARLSKNGEIIAETMTDGFGDFKFDNLPENSGPYGVEIRQAGYAAVSRQAELATSIYLGKIELLKI